MGESCSEGARVTYAAFDVKSILPLLAISAPLEPTVPTAATERSAP